MSQAALNTRGREQEKGARRSNGGQLAGIIFLLMVAGTILWGSWMVLGWMKDASRLPLSRLVVTGERHYTTNDDIRQAILSLGPPGTFMTQDVNVIQQQIERLPWIKQASVRKQWPDELKIHLVEFVPFARWNDQLMVDSEGNAFSVPAERIGNKKNADAVWPGRWRGGCAGGIPRDKPDTRGRQIYGKDGGDDRASFMAGWAGR
ncbi:hypothetical protein OS42_29130 [Dickeya oryzae]